MRAVAGRGLNKLPNLLPDTTKFLAWLSELSAVTLLCICGAASTIALLIWIGIINLGALNSVSLAISQIVAIVALFLGVARLLRLGIAAFRKSRRERRLVKLLDELSHVEATILGTLVLRGNQVFTTTIDGGEAATLVAKGLVIQTPGQHSALDWPFSIPDGVWREMKRRKATLERFAVAGSPWRTHWMVQ